MLDYQSNDWNSSGLHARMPLVSHVLHKKNSNRLSTLLCHDYFVYFLIRFAHLSILTHSVSSHIRGSNAYGVGVAMTRPQFSFHFACRKQHFNLEEKNGNKQEVSSAADSRQDKSKTKHRNEIGCRRVNQFSLNMHAHTTLLFMNSTNWIIWMHTCTRKQACPFTSPSPFQNDDGKSEIESSSTSSMYESNVIWTADEQKKTLLWFKHFESHIYIPLRI